MSDTMRSTGSWAVSLRRRGIHHDLVRAGRRAFRHRYASSSSGAGSLPVYTEPTIEPLPRMLVRNPRARRCTERSTRSGWGRGRSAGRWPRPRVDCERGNDRGDGEGGHRRRGGGLGAGELGGQGAARMSDRDRAAAPPTSARPRFWVRLRMRATSLCDVLQARHDGGAFSAPPGDPRRSSAPICAALRSAWPRRRDGTGRS